MCLQGWCSSTLQTKLCTVCLTVRFNPITHSSPTVKHLKYIGLVTRRSRNPPENRSEVCWGGNWTDRTAGKRNKNKPRESSGRGGRVRHPAVSEAGTHLWVQWPLPSPITLTPWDIWESASITNQRETRRNRPYSHHPLTTLRSSKVHHPIP